MNLEENIKNLNACDLEKIKEKLFNLHKQKVDLLCKAIKFSIKLMSKLLSSFGNSENLINNNLEFLTKIKLFFKITRMVVENAREQIKIGTGKENDFFTM